MKKAFLTYLLIQLLSGFGVESLFAQEYPWINYSVEDGLASNYVYGAMELGDGTVWAFTEKGVARFDGQEFHNYNVEDGLADNDIWQLERDTKGRGIMSSFGNRISFIDGDSICQAIDVKNKVMGNAILLNGETYQIDHIKNRYVEIEDTTKYIKFHNDSYVSRNLKVQFTADTISIQDINKQNEIWKFKLAKLGHYDITGVINRIIFGPAKDQVIYFNSKGWLSANFKTRKFTEKSWLEYGFYKTFEYSYLWMSPEIIFYVPNGFIRIDSQGNEVEVFDIGDLKHEAEILRVIPDNKGNIWVGTQGSGLYFLPRHNRTSKNILKLHPKSNGVEKLLPTLSGKVLALPDDGSPIIIHPDLKTEAITKISLRNFSDVIELPSDRFLFTNSTQFETTSNCYSMSTFFDSHSTFTYTKHINNWIQELRGHPSILFGFDNSSDLILLCVKERANQLFAMKSRGDSLTIFDYKLEVNSFSKALDGGVWMTANDGVYKHINDQLVPIFKHPVLQLTVSFYQNNRKLIFATKKEDIYSLNLENKEFKKLATLSNINRLRRGINGTILCCTNHGLIRLDENTGKVTSEYKVSYGLSSNQINDAYETENGILVANSQGVDNIPSEIEEPSGLQLPFKIISFLANNKHQDFSSGPMEFNSLQNNLQIQYALQDYESAGDIKYYTKLSPIQIDWQESKVPAVDYWGLSPGDYTFELKAKRFNGQELTYSKDISFKIKPTLFRNPWFYLSTLALGLGLFIWITHRKQSAAIDSFNQENALNKKISELQLSALRSQMNPHFVFNTLGAIQYYIQTQKAEKADDYLSQFALLMRKYLDASKQSLINLEEELELLQLYTNLEVMRYDQNFEVELVVDDEIDKFDTMIPSVLIQPFVENAILHGLHSRKIPGGLLKLSFKQVAADLQVVISDNGIGVNNSKMQNKSFHKPTGLANISDRIKTIGHSTGMEIELSYLIPHPKEDLFPGHEVILTFKNIMT